MRIQLLNGASLDLDTVALVGELYKNNGPTISYIIRFKCGDKYERSNIGMSASTAEEIEREHSLITGLFVGDITLEHYVRSVSTL